MQPFTFEETSTRFAVEIITYAVMIGTPIILVLVFKEYIGKVVSGFFWRRGGFIRNYDVVKINGDYARVLHQGWLKTSFNVYIIENNKVVGGEIMMVDNHELKRMRIRKPLTLLDIPSILRDVKH